MLGMKSENSVPLCPCGVKTRGLASTAALGLVKARRRSLVSSGGSGLPCHFWSSGLGSKRSIWLGPPSMNMKMTFLALGAKCGLRGASGFCSTAAARPSRSSICASAMVPMPPAHSRKNSRRL